MAEGQILCTDPLQAADDFLDLVIPARLMTSVALGNSDTLAHARNHVGHAVDIFLRFYGVAPQEESAAAVSNKKAKVRATLTNKSLEGEMTLAKSKPRLERRNPNRV